MKHLFQIPIARMHVMTTRGKREAGKGEYPVTTIEKIRGALADMPPINRRIAVYILENHQSIGFSSIRTLSEALGVSSATILRFSRSLGFEGYADLRKTIQEEIKRRLSPYEKIALTELDTLPLDEQFKKLCQNEMGNLRKTLDEISRDDLAKMVEGVASADRVFVSGFGVSHYVIQILGYYFESSLDKSVVTISGSVSDYSAKLRSFGPGDCLYLMTFPSYSREALHVAELAKSRGGKVFLFTDSPRCPVYHLADAVLRCENNALLTTNSYVGLVAVVQIFANLLFLSDKARVVPRIVGVQELEQNGYERLGQGEEEP